MSRKWHFGSPFRKNAVESEKIEQDVPSQPSELEHTSDEDDRPIEHKIYLPEIKGASLKLWELWTNSSVPPLLEIAPAKNVRDPERAAHLLEQERVRLIVKLEQDAKSRLHLIEKGKEQENFSLSSSCQVYLSRDKMLAWVFFFPPFGPEGQFEAGALGKALQDAGVMTGIDSNEVVRLLQEHPYFELIPIAAGTEPVEGSDGKVTELFPREVTREVMINEDGTADYRSMNYVRQIEKDTCICDIVLPQEGTAGVQVDGKIVRPKPVRPAKVPKGSNTAISDDGLHLVATREGHLEFANGSFHVRPVLEIRGDVDYSTGNIEFNGDVHIYKDVREGFEVRASGTVTIDGLVEAATVEAGGDLVISRGVVGDHRALLRSKGCVRAKYLENCVLYAGKTVYADCIMTSQIFSDEGINVTSGRGSVIGGALTAAYSIRAKMVGAQSGRRTELTLGVLPYVQTEMQAVEDRLEEIHAEMERLEKDLGYLERIGGQESSTPELARARLRKSMLGMKEKKQLAARESLKLILPDLSKCRFEADDVYPVTALKIHNRTWVAKEPCHRCRMVYDVKEEEIKSIY